MPSSDAQPYASTATELSLDPEGLAHMREGFLADNLDFAGNLRDDAFYHEDERDYKVELAALAHELLPAERFAGAWSVEDAQALAADLRGVLTRSLAGSGHRPQNLLNWRYFDFLTKMTGEEAVGFAGVVGDLLYGEGESPERLERFNGFFAPLVARHGLAGPAVTRSFPTLLLMLIAPEQDIYIRSDNFNALSRLLLGRRLFSNEPLDAAQYRDALALSHALFDTLAQWGWQPRDLIDVQSFVWRGTTYRPPEEGEDDPAGAPAEGESTSSPAPNSSSFARLVGALAEDGLYFPAELVANYLLALQAKRFVVLTGISGTGKTKLAQAVARHFRPVVEHETAGETDEGAVDIRVRPYMHKYNRTVIPVAVSNLMDLPSIDPGSNSGRMIVQSPIGRQELGFWRDPNRNVTTLLFRGAFWDWFRETFEEDDHFLLSVLPGEGDQDGDGLEFRLSVKRKILDSLDNYAVIAVHPDWTDNRGLLGYHNPLTGSYIVTPFLRLLLRAREDADRAVQEDRAPHPFFVVLDEMNLARVEHYFADFLSCLESGEPLHLHDDPRVAAGETEDGREIPMQLHVPPNLFFTGTVNIDETTYMFSPKVLDRAFAIELNTVDLDALGAVAQRARGGGDGPLALRRLPDMPAQRQRPSTRDWRAFMDMSDEGLPELVGDLNRRLADFNRHFGYRVANEIARFVTLAAEQAGATPETLWAALDLALLQKVLPKLHGTQQELQDVLEALFALALTGNERELSGLSAGGWQAWTLADAGTRLVRERHGPMRDDDEPPNDDVAANAVETAPPAAVTTLAPRLPRTATKLWRMLDRLRRQGFTSYIE